MKKCPFSAAAPASAQTAADQAKASETATEARLDEVSRRTLLEWGTIGLGGLMTFGVSACKTSGASQLREEDGVAADAADPAADGSGDPTADDEVEATKLVFLTEYDKIGKDNAANPAARIGGQGALVKKWLAENPGVLAAELRQSRPVLHTGGPVPTLIARNVDVRNVLKHPELFQVIPYKGEVEAILGHFTLGDIDLTRHNHEKEAMQQAVSSNISKDHRDMVRREAEALVAKAVARGDGKIDMVKDVARWLPIKVVTNYFGVPSGDAVPAGMTNRPSEQDMWQWIADTFHSYFLNLGKDPAVTATGRASGKLMMDYLDELITYRMKNGGPATDVLGQFIAMQSSAKYQDVFPNNQRIAANISGIITGAATGTVEKGTCNAMSVLLGGSHAKSVLDGAIKAAQADDLDTLYSYYNEALRFRPQGGGIARVVKTDTTVAGTAIPAGALVLALHPSAMMDPAAVTTPTRFMANRPKTVYLHFGAETYMCLGKYMAPLEISEIFRALLKLPKLRAGAAGLVYNGVYPDSFELEYG